MGEGPFHRTPVPGGFIAFARIRAQPAMSKDTAKSKIKTREKDWTAYIEGRAYAGVEKVEDANYQAVVVTIHVSAADKAGLNKLPSRWAPGELLAQSLASLPDRVGIALIAAPMMSASRLRLAPVLARRGS